MFRTVLIIESVVAQVLGLLLVAALISARPRSSANRLLALALVCVVARQFLLMMEIAEATGVFWYLFRLSFPLQLLAIPAYYLYVVALTTPDFKLRRQDAWHLIPAGFGLAWYVVILIWGSPSLFEQSPAHDVELYARAIAKIAVMIPYFLAGRRAVLEKIDRVATGERRRPPALSRDGPLATGGSRRGAAVLRPRGNTDGRARTRRRAADAHPRRGGANAER